MHRFFVNFRKSASDRAAELSVRAYNHYKRFGGAMEKMYNPIKQIHSKYLGRFYGQGKKGTNQPR